METKLGGCHCGNLRYEVTIDLTQPVIECNCSHCQIKGLLLSFVPEENLQITKETEPQTEYRFNTHKIAHRFCPMCGVECFGLGEGEGGKKTAAINVRTIDGIDLHMLNRTPYDGRGK